MKELLKFSVAGSQGTARALCGLREAEANPTPSCRKTELGHRDPLYGSDTQILHASDMPKSSLLMK